jgi:nucleoid-associated protein YgaU
LQFISEIEKGMIQPVVAPGPYKPKDAQFTLNLLYNSATFTSSGNHPAFAMKATQNRTYPYAANQSIACEIMNWLHVIQTEGQNINERGTPYQVANGDSLWKIANHFYGDGRLHLLVAAANGIPDNKMNALPRGKKIMIQPIGMFRANNQLLFVNRGDSMWRIASRREGGSNAFAALKTTNAGIVSNPDRIYPIEVLRSVDRPTP